MVADNPETARARALLKSSSEALERSRNRPHYSSSWLEPRERSPATVEVPIFRKVRQDAPAPTPAVSRAEFSALTEAVIDKLGEALGRIGKLERELADLNGSPPLRSGDVIEWPIQPRKSA